MEKKEVDILDLFSALHKGRQLIFGGTFAMCVFAGALSFLVPEEYEATAQLLPPKEQKQGFGFSDLLSALPIPTLRRRRRRQRRARAARAPTGASRCRVRGRRRRGRRTGG